MTNTELLKNSRDILLSLHKSLVDLERSLYEGLFGKQTPGQFLNLLIEDEHFAWLRAFSTLIVEIDEMFAQRDGFSEEQVDAHLGKVKDLIGMNLGDKEFAARYQQAIRKDADVASRHGQLRQLLKIKDQA